jgi:hypothetical protein
VREREREKRMCEEGGRVRRGRLELLADEIIGAKVAELQELQVRQS